MKKKVLIIGSGLGGLSTALRLSVKGYDVTILEKHSKAGGRLNQLQIDGFTFDVGPSFMSMSYELNELFESCGVKNPIKMTELDPLYNVYFEGNDKPYKIWKTLENLEKEFAEIEPNLAAKVEKYLKRGGEFFHDTEDAVIKSNFNSLISYLFQLSKVPKKHLPYLFRTMWNEVERNFDSNEVRVIFSLVAFFLGSTPFQTPAIYSLLNYTEMKHDGYWKVEGGMYKIVDELLKLLSAQKVKIVYNTEIVGFEKSNNFISSLIDQNGKKWTADIFISNSDAASFRGKILKREKFSEEKLDKMEWTLAPFTIYLGVKGSIDNLAHHNYFLGKNFRGYADAIFTSSISPQKPYYYVNVSSKSYKECAPDGCENIFILCPVPDLRFKKDWSDREELANNIIDDLSKRTGFDIKNNVLVKKIFDPEDWGKMFNLYKGSGLGLSHGMLQVGAFRPKNKDEQFKNLFYVGASTTPGTGLPMVIISSKLVEERIEEVYGNLS
ncbi:MAG: phytoene desaturase [Ignavibacteriaceae bacterium]|nr:phytoene desaturase [Ignavibacteriaceae bacterium]